MKLLGRISGAVAILMAALALVARFLCPYKVLLGIHALTFLIVTGVMLLFSIAFFLGAIVGKS